MKRSKKPFMQQYREILALKNTHSYTTNKVDILKNVSLLSIIIITIFTLTGLLLNTLENLNYVFYALSMVVIGSFVIYRLSEEMKFKAKYSLEYNSLVAIVNDTLNLVVIILFSNSIFFYFFMGRLFSIGEFIVFGIITFVLLIIVSRIENNINYYFEEGPGSIPLTVSWITLLYISLFYILGIDSVIVTYIVSSGIIGLTVLYKYVISKYDITSKHLMNGVAVFFIFAFAGIVSLDRNLYSDDEELSKPLVIPESNVIDQIEYAEDTLVYGVISSEENILVRTSSDYYLYDNEMNFIKTIEPGSYFFDNNVLRLVRSDFASNYEDITHPTIWHIYYHLDENWDIVEDFTNYDWDNPYIFYYEGVYGNASSIMNRGSGELRYINVLSDDFNVSYDYETLSDENKIIYSDLNNIVYQKDYRLYAKSSSSYSNGKIIVEDEDEETIYVYDFNDYLNDDLDDYISIDIGEYEVSRFTYTDDGLYYFSLYDNSSDLIYIFEVYNDDGKLVNELLYDYSRVHVTNNYIFSVNPDNQNILQLLDKANPSIYVVNGESSLISSLAFTSLLSALFIVEFKIRSLKRGVQID